MSCKARSEYIAAQKRRCKRAGQNRYMKKCDKAPAPFEQLKTCGITEAALQAEYESLVHSG